MPDSAKMYSSLNVQPIDLVNEFKIDYCLASVIKWLTKWHMDNHRSSHLDMVRYYIPMCAGTKIDRGFMFALKMFCLANGFIHGMSESCLLLNVVKALSDSSSGSTYSPAFAELNNAYSEDPQRSIKISH